MALFSSFVLLGGNTSETLELISLAEDRISNLFGDIKKSSSVYKSSSWGFESRDYFFNRVIDVSTFLEPLEQMRCLLDIERQLGRCRDGSVGYSSRGIDIDVLFIDDLIIETSALVVPHPRLHLRRFTLVPLCEKWGEKVHPSLHKTLHELLAECKDEGEVFLFGC
jgi:2-amino-4-hydroxy-6-hydroxymethyldihydropteridine diphosphokinase